MKEPKCPKTISGKHKWKDTAMIQDEYQEYEIKPALFGLAYKQTSYWVGPKYGKVTPYCEHCGIINDTYET